MEVLISLINAQKDRLFFYSPYNFIREVGEDKQLSYLKTKLENWQSENPDFITFRTEADNLSYYFLYQYLPWDSSYFQYPVYKLFTVFYPEGNHQALCAAVSEFKKHLAQNKGYFFAEIPAEDIKLIQAFNENGFRLTETRLTYFKDQLSLHQHERFRVRKGTLSDIPNLRKVAAAMRNNYDRFHADPFFDLQTADGFLATYIEEALKGLNDVVLVPDELNTPADAFLTANYNYQDWEKIGIPVSKIVLSAVSSQTNKGWFKKLFSEMTYYLYEKGARVIFVNTQATNRAAFKTWEKLDYQLGCTTHIITTDV